MRFQCIQRHKNTWPVAEMCECFEVSASDYYAWSTRKPSARSVADVDNKERIESLHKRSKSRYGYRPIYHHLRDEKLECGRDRALRLMKELGIEGIQKKGFKPLGTDSSHDFGCSANLLKELGKPTGCDQIWVADTTYLRTMQGWCYLATIMDLFSRRIIGWSVSVRNDNAAMESFFGRFKITSAGDITFADEEHARSAVFEYIEAFYNGFRKHSALVSDILTCGESG